MISTNQVMMTALAQATQEPTGGVAGWAVDLMDRLGAPGAGLAVALENLFPPLPSEVILPLAGFAASRGDLGLVSVILFTTLGSVVGALALYGVGAVLGRDRTRALAARIPLMKLEDVDKAEAWFARHGAKAVLIGRVVPVVRSLISVPAGVERMRLSLFLALTAIGSLVWNSALIIAGYLLGEKWNVVESYVGILQWVVLAAAVLAVVWFIVVKLRARRSPSENVQ
ncbi:membrane protein DedA with SNARE-associated domain [Kribbella orskensis]|uniref:Membrane protein DedA with SNARE-associated domain n=1 Tax=Kribbella orskensis TaxID=2512216 RepID=A0ABY2BCK0_9ACTN|nr:MULTISPECIES: DedA family protein [Kribbella]TCN35039.1 membrane protein DedA with SNARE-associated domain [Kribbella sp. VKM Ac-2500]TCO16406.1 membrane protein DedA with SNARE-associated domain [Kribbella orskensis]